MSIYFFKKLSANNVVGFFTFRYHNEGEFNLALHAGDTSKTIENRKKLSRLLNIPIEKFVFANQTHSSNVVILNESCKGKGIYSCEDSLPDTDAMITKENFCPIVLTADCVPVIIFDKNNRVGGVIHAGWKGIYNEIHNKTFLMLKEYYNTKAEDIILCIGPHISFNCYEVGEDLYKDFINKSENYKAYFKFKNGKIYFNMKGIIVDFFINCGVDINNIEDVNRCTYLDENLYSYRRQREKAGRIATGIYIY